MCFLHFHAVTVQLLEEFEIQGLYFIYIDVLVDSTDVPILYIITAAL